MAAKRTRALVSSPMGLVALASLFDGEHAWQSQLAKVQGSALSTNTKRV